MRNRTKLLIAVVVVLLLLFLSRRRPEVQVGPIVTLGNDPAPLAVQPQLFPKPVIGPISARPVPVQAEVLTSAPQNPYTQPATVVFPCLASRAGVDLPTDYLIPAALEIHGGIHQFEIPTNPTHAGVAMSTIEREENISSLEQAYNRMRRNERLCEMQSFDQRQRDFDQL